MAQWDTQSPGGNWFMKKSLKSKISLASLKKEKILILKSNIFGEIQSWRPVTAEDKYFSHFSTGKYHFKPNNVFFSFLYFILFLVLDVKKGCIILMLYLNPTYNTNKTDDIVFRCRYNTGCLCYIKVTLTYYGQMYFVQTLNKNARNLQGNVRTCTLLTSHV